MLQAMSMISASHFNEHNLVHFSMQNELYGFYYITLLISTGYLNVRAQPYSSLIDGL